MTKTHRYTKEQIEYIRKIAPGTYLEDIVSKFNEHFQASVTQRSMSSVMYRKGIKNGIKGGTETRFKKGNIPWSKGKKVEVAPGSKKGWFKKGNLPPSHKAIGSEATYEGIVYIKTAEPNIWQPKHRFLYEQHYGFIPDDHVVIFADGNKTNFELTNLLLVKRKVVMAAAKRNLLSDNGDITKSGVLLAECLMEINKKER